MEAHGGPGPVIANERAVPQRRLTYAALDRMVGEQRRKYVGTNQ
jgi:hypothetical protein